MKDASKPTGPPATTPDQGQSRSQGDQGLKVIEGEVLTTMAPQPAAKGSQAHVATGGSAAQDLELLSRFLVGVAVLGGDELLKRLRMVQQGIEAQPPVQGDGLAEATTLGLMRYLGIGLLLRGQRGVAKGVRTGFYLSLGTASWFFDKLNALTDNRLMRPIRRPIESSLVSLGRGTAAAIGEGRIEEQRGRLLAGEAIGEILDEVLDYMVTNPDLSDFIQELLGRQSVGLASVARNGARQVTATSDDALEGIVRRLLGRAPRKALPPSPLAGKPQTMYSAVPPAPQAENHDE